jgi:hypothetical protein
MSIKAGPPPSDGRSRCWEGDGLRRSTVGARFAKVARGRFTPWRRAAVAGGLAGVAFEHPLELEGVEPALEATSVRRRVGGNSVARRTRTRAT